MLVSYRIVLLSELIVRVLYMCLYMHWLSIVILYIFQYISPRVSARTTLWGPLY